MALKDIIGEALAAELTTNVDTLSNSLLDLILKGSDDALSNGLVRGGIKSLLKLVPSTVTLEMPGENPFRGLAYKEYPNLALVWSGNPALTTSAGYVPPVSAGNLLLKDQILQGRRNTFPGYNRLKTLLFMTIPALVIIHVVAVALAIRSKHATLKDYAFPIRDPFQASQTNNPDEYMQQRSLRMMVWLAAGPGMIGLVLNAVYPNIFTCTDPLITATIASIDTEPTYQWIFVIIAVSTLWGLGITIEQLERRDADVAIRGIREWKAAALYEDDLASKEDDIKNPPLSEPPLWRRVCIQVFFLPFLALASAPAFGYVTSRNVPAGSGWYYTVLGNSVVVALINLIPPVSSMLARFKFVQDDRAVASFPRPDADIAIAVTRTQVAIAITFDVTTVLLAPMIAVFLLDESCMRYYLKFTPDLANLMDGWGIGMVGVEAYRPNICSRKLLIEFAYVWLSMVLIDAFATPAIELLHWAPILKSVQRKLQERFTRMIRTENDSKPAESDVVTIIRGKSVISMQPSGSAGAKGPFPSGEIWESSARNPTFNKTCKFDLPELDDRVHEEMVESALRMQTKLVTIASRTLTATIFGALVPVQLILAPLSAWLNLRATQWISMHSDDVKAMQSQESVSFGKQIAHRVLVQSPFYIIRNIGHALNLALAMFIFVDLGFDTGPIIFYWTFVACEMVTMIFLRRFWKKHDLKKKRERHAEEEIEYGINPVRGHARRQAKDLVEPEMAFDHIIGRKYKRDDASDCRVLNNLNAGTEVAIEFNPLEDRRVDRTIPVINHQASAGVFSADTMRIDRLATWVGSAEPGRRSRTRMSHRNRQVTKQLYQAHDAVDKTNESREEGASRVKQELIDSLVGQMVQPGVDTEPHTSTNPPLVQQHDEDSSTTPRRFRYNHRKLSRTRAIDQRTAAPTVIDI